MSTPAVPQLIGYAEEEPAAIMSVPPATEPPQRQRRARATEKAFFRCYVRLPEGEALERLQWRQVADRIEKQLGFAGQGRAVAFHHGSDGETHMHIAWSRTPPPLPQPQRPAPAAGAEGEEFED